MKVVLTGASAGIGRACAEAFCGDGHVVIGIARSRDALDDLASRLPLFTALPCDLSDEAALSTLEPRIREAAGEGAVDVLINNAGYGAAGPVELVPLEDWKAQYAVNVFGTIAVTQAVLPLLRLSGRGRIVNVSSVAGRVYAPFFAPYYSTKHALECISDALRVELRSQGIDVSIVEPGAVKTGFARREDAMLERCASESEIYRDPIRKVIAWHERMAAQGIPAEKVVETIRKAVEAKRPKHRYVVPAFPSLAFIALARFLPTRLADAAVQRILGLGGSATARPSRRPAPPGRGSA